MAVYEKTMLTPEEYGATLNPPKKGYQIRKLLRANRIIGARLRAGRWLVPRNADIIGGGRHADYYSREGMSVGEFAKRHGRTHQRVYQLLYKGRIKGAEYSREGGWTIPYDAEWPAMDINYDPSILVERRERQAPAPTQPKELRIKMPGSSSIRPKG